MANELILAEKQDIVLELAETLRVTPQAMLQAFKMQCFKQSADKVTDAQVVVYCQVAAKLGLNPLQPGMLYAYPEKDGSITPIIGPDGMYKLLSEHPDVDGWKTEVIRGDDGKVIGGRATIWRKKSEHPIEYEAWVEEWETKFWNDRRKQWETTPFWRRPAHAIQIRAIKHAGRQIIHGMPMDDDERMVSLNPEQYVVGTPPPEPPTASAPMEKVSKTEAMKARLRGDEGATKEEQEDPKAGPAPEPEPEPDPEPEKPKAKRGRPKKEDAKPEPEPSAPEPENAEEAPEKSAPEPEPEPEKPEKEAPHPETGKSPGQMMMESFDKFLEQLNKLDPDTSIEEWREYCTERGNDAGFRSRRTFIEHLSGLGIEKGKAFLAESIERASKTADDMAKEKKSDGKEAELPY